MILSLAFDPSSLHGKKKKKERKKSHLSSQYLHRPPPDLTEDNVTAWVASVGLAQHVATKDDF